MSRFNELLHGDLDTVHYHLNAGENITHEELVCAVLNLVNRLRRLEKQ